MNDFNSLYIVWTLEPDYARDFFIKRYKSLDGFIYKCKPCSIQLEKANKIVNQIKTTTQ
jgi:hypothetical protein